MQARKRLCLLGAGVKCTMCPQVGQAIALTVAVHDGLTNVVLYVPILIENDGIAPVQSDLLLAGHVRRLPNPECGQFPCVQSKLLMVFRNGFPQDESVTARADAGTNRKHARMG